MDSGQTRLISILVITVIVAGGAMVALQYIQPSGDTTAEYVVEVIGTSGNAQNVTLSEMMMMDSVTRNSSYQNTYGNVRGVGVYTGVNVSDLLDLVGGVDEGDQVRIVASDGYSQTFERSKVYPNSSIWNYQGYMILAYEYQGLTVPEYEDGLRLAFLPDDGYYSNADANASTEPDPAAAGPQWISNVVKIQVLETLIDETFNISESFLRTLSSTTGEGGYKKKSGDIVGPFNFTGVAFTTLLPELITLPEDYVLIARSGDGFTIEYEKSVIEGTMNGYTPSGDPLDEIHSTMVLAYEENGTPIADGGPLKIVFLNEDGNLTDGFRWAKAVVSIRILELSSTALILSNYILSHVDYFSVDGIYVLDEKWV